MQLDKIRARIQKLLAMAQDSSSPHEAAIAAERVQKLMAKFNLEMADVIAEELQDERARRAVLPIGMGQLHGVIRLPWLGRRLRVLRD